MAAVKSEKELIKKWVEEAVSPEDTAAAVRIVTLFRMCHALAQNTDVAARLTVAHLSLKPTDGR